MAEDLDVEGSDPDGRYLWLWAWLRFGIGLRFRIWLRLRTRAIQEAALIKKKRR